MHQHCWTGWPAATAHWLAAPQAGQRLSGLLVTIDTWPEVHGGIILHSPVGVSMSDDEQHLFRDEMSDVVPLQRQERVRADKRSGAPDPSLQRRRKAAVSDAHDDGNILTEDGLAITPLDPWYVLDFKRPGVQNGVFRKLKQGRYEADARLDLHRMTTAVARRELFDFIQESVRLGIRSVVIVHGKGESRAQRERSSILKGCTDHWLRELPEVQAFHSAQPRHGGTGAVYVLLRKSEDKKRENREQFMKGRVPYDAS